MVLENETITDPKAVLIGEHFRGKTTFDFHGANVKPGEGPRVERCTFEGAGPSLPGHGGSYAIHLIGRGWVDFTDCTATDGDKLIVGGGARWRGGTWKRGSDGWDVGDDDWFVIDGVAVSEMGFDALDHVDILQSQGGGHGLMRNVVATCSVAHPDCPGWNSMAFLESRVRTVDSIRVVANRVLRASSPNASVVQNGVWLWHDPSPSVERPELIRSPRRMWVDRNEFFQCNGRPVVGNYEGWQSMVGQNRDLSKADRS